MLRLTHIVSSPKAGGWWMEEKRQQKHFGAHGVPRIVVSVSCKSQDEVLECVSLMGCTTKVLSETTSRVYYPWQAPRSRVKKTKRDETKHIPHMNYENTETCPKTRRKLLKMTRTGFQAMVRELTVIRPRMTATTTTTIVTAVHTIHRHTVGSRPLPWRSKGLHSALPT